MILIGDDNRIPLRQHLTKGLREYIGVGCGRRTKADLIDVHAQVARKPGSCRIHFFAAQPRGFKTIVGLDFSFSIKTRQAVRDLLARIGPTRIFKQGLPGKTGL